MGKPQITVRLSPSLMGELKQYIERTGTSKTDVVASALAKYLVEPSYSSYDFGARHPNGGLPEDYSTQNRVHNRSIYPLVSSTIERSDSVTQDVYPFFSPNNSNHRQTDCDYLELGYCPLE